MLDSVIKTNKKHYPQTFLEACKYEITTKKYINEDFKSDSDPNDETEWDSGSNDDDDDETKSDIDNDE